MIQNKNELNNIVVKIDKNVGENRNSKSYIPIKMYTSANV